MQRPADQLPAQTSRGAEEAVAASPEGAKAGAAQPAADTSQPCMEANPPAAEGGPAPGEDEEFDPEMSLYLVRTLQKVLPGAELTEGSIKTLTTLLDGLTQRILEEAKQISLGTEEDAAADIGEKPLTSLDIHKALKRVLPGDPGETLRPYLPAEVKQAWHLDKQSLKGVKRLKTGSSAEKGGGGGGSSNSGAGKENMTSAAGSHQ